MHATAAHGQTKASTTQHQTHLVDSGLEKLHAAANIPNTPLNRQIKRCCSKCGCAYIKEHVKRTAKKNTTGDRRNSGTMQESLTMTAYTITYSAADSNLCD